MSARFANGDKAIRLGALFWIDGSSSAASDLKRLWLFSEQDDQSLDSWLAIHHEGGARELKQHARDNPGLQANDSKKAYLAQVRRFFEVGENAFTLLNRAAGLNSQRIDEIFKLVLDDHRRLTGRPRWPASSTTWLQSTANGHGWEHQSLLPIAETYEEHQSATNELDQQLLLKDILPIWFAQTGYELWNGRKQDLERQLDEGRKPSSHWPMLRDSTAKPTP